MRVNVLRDRVIERSAGRVPGDQLEAAGTTLGAAAVGYAGSGSLLVRQEVGRVRG